MPLHSLRYGRVNTATLNPLLVFSILNNKKSFWLDNIITILFDEESISAFETYFCFLSNTLLRSNFLQTWYVMCMYTKLT